ncbi:MAG: DUF3343 domain-containing protein [Andreesenia angusta]|nr:DUF3343 domain-containing protein [Andreesenia angusta]
MIETEMNVITFRSTHHAIKTEKALKKREFKIKVIPTPREITASCGLSIRFEDEEKDDIFSVLKEMISEGQIILRGVFNIIRTKEKVEVNELDINSKE